jgi:hypothetical protein
MVLATESRIKLWDIQYGIGLSPTTWDTLDTFTSGSDWITQSYSFTRNNFGSLLDNQESVWFRFASTTLSTGGGSRPTVAIDNFALQVVPEPTTLMLIFVGLMVFIAKYWYLLVSKKDGIPNLLIKTPHGVP